MPSELSRRIKQNKENEANIREKMSREYVRPSEDEKEYSRKIIDVISKQFSDDMVKNDLEALRIPITEAVTKQCEELDLPLEKRLRVKQIVLMTVLGYGPIEEYMQDPDVTDINVQRFDNIVIEKNGKSQNVDAVFYDDNHLMNIIQRMIQPVGRQLNLSSPIVDAWLPDGSRINATMRPISPDGATLSIRKFAKEKLTAKDYIRFGSITKEMFYFLGMCVRARISVLVSGGTSAGKTTLLNALSQFIPEDELIITIEDSLELKLQQHNVRRMLVRESTTDEMMNVTQETLVKASLRQNPDRIIISEVRDGTIVDLIDAMSTGHEGAMSTIHANNPRELFDVRLPILYGKNSNAKNTSNETIALQASLAIGLVVQIRKLKDGSRKITHISSVEGLTDDYHVMTKDIFIYDEYNNLFKATGHVPEKLISKMESLGMRIDKSIFKRELIQPGTSEEEDPEQED